MIVVAEIEDTGPGIPEDKLAKIFEPFFTTKPTGKGTGLGLSVVKTIIDLHGATIDLRNLPDRGARVTIMFQV
jgi:signal transduction histidine kinase